MCNDELNIHIFQMIRTLRIALVLLTASNSLFFLTFDRKLFEAPTFIMLVRKFSIQIGQHQ